MTSVCMLVQNPYDGDVRVRRKAEALVAAKYSVDVLALRGASAARTYSLNGVNVRTIGLGKKRGSLARYAFEYLAFFLWAFVTLARLMPRRRYAVVDVNTLPDFLIFAAAPARWMGAKLVLDMHEITPEFYVSKYEIAEGSWIVRVLSWQERLSFAYADRVITIHEPIEDLLVGRGLSREKSVVVMNSVDEADFTKPAPPAAAAEAARRGTAFVMMYHGTLTRIYGLDLAIEAFAVAQREMPGAEFWILGDGTEKAALQQQAQTAGLGSKVKLLGSVPPSEVSAWVAKSDIGVLPMRRDVFLDYSFPNKLSEYIIVGKSVIVPRLKAIGHYFSEDALAYFEPNSPADLAKQMIRVSREPALRARLAARAKAEYAPIRWDVMKQRYLELIEQLAGPRRPAMENSRRAQVSGVLE